MEPSGKTRERFRLSGINFGKKIGISTEYFPDFKYGECDFLYSAFHYVGLCGLMWAYVRLCGLMCA